MGWLIGFIATIFAANWAIEEFGIIPIGFGLVAPAGVLLAGLAFTFRDGVHERFGWQGAALSICAGGLLSWFISPTFATASVIAFLLSEFSDLLIYTPLRKRRWLWAVALSNTVGVVADSILFLWMAFGSLNFLTGQIVGKLYMTVAAVIGIYFWQRHRFSLKEV